MKLYTCAKYLEAITYHKCQIIPQTAEDCRFPLINYPAYKRLYHVAKLKN